MPTVEVFAWNPLRPRFRGRVGRRLPLQRRVTNFGDLLGPVVVDGMLRRFGLVGAPAVRHAQLLTIGSVLHFAELGAVVWGTGVNGKVSPDEHRTSDLDVRAVRGPLTRAFLEDRGIRVPEVFGDPGLLLGTIRPDLLTQPKRRAVTVVQNLNDYALHRPGRAMLDPRRPLEHCLQTIAASELVVGSSLHGIITAEALGIPARLVRSGTEPELKYADYYLGTGRPDWHAAASIEEAVAAGGAAPPTWSPEPLIAAFPTDLWQRPHEVLG